MATRLSDLLERIRPAGAPGAATEATTRRSRDAAEEIAAVAAAVAVFEREAGEEVTRARAEAVRLHADAERRARRITTDIPDRVAGAAAQARTGLAPGDEGGERARLAAEATERIARLRAAAPERTRLVVDRAMAAIWDLVTPGGGAA